MVLHVLCQEYRGRRCIALVADDNLSLTFHAEYLSGSKHSITDPAPPKCIVELSRDVNWRERRSCREIGKSQGTIGLVNFGSNLFLGVITASSQVATVRPGETVRRIDGVEFYCLNTSDFDEPSANVSRGTYRNSYHESSDDYNTRESLQNPCASLQKLLVDGSFYYSLDFDLTDRLQDRVSQKSAFDIESLDQNFLWNSFLITPLLQFRRNLPDAQKSLLDSSGILTSVIRGSVQSTIIPAALSPIRLADSTAPCTLTIISRLSSRRAGMRFYSRGIDDEGNVSNSVETETILYLPSRVSFSYTQVRGSIPCFWEQAAHISQQRIQVTRSPAATQPAFNKHFDALQLSYGPVHVVNLLSRSKPAEADLAERFHYHLSESPLKQRPGGLLQETLFDFHAETSGPGGYQAATVISRYIQDSIESFGYFLSDDDPTGQCQVVTRQEGVFRTNCLDCLDRTNFIQTLISRMVLEMFFAQNDGHGSDEFWRFHAIVWADNGDLLSKNYTGTGALKSSFTRHGKMSFAGAVSDMRKSATRFVYNHLLDGPRQGTIDLLLGTLSGMMPVELVDPLNDAVNSELKKRSAEFSSYKRIRIWTGTFNVNGKEEGVRGDLSPWLLSHMDTENDSEEPGIVVVAFQEIVELSPQQIMSTDSFVRLSWENSVIQTLNSFAEKRSSSKYTLLRSGQLVGAALLVFAKEDLVPQIRNIEWAEKKTGLSGMAGNKGGIAIRMDLASTKLCFVTAHLAAGHLNVEERDRDYMTISAGLRFAKSQTIDDHDAIIWLGDFNYRINLDNLITRDLISAGNTEALLSMDQLKQQMQIGSIFQNYSEGPITFPPTYKFNHGTDIYDTSEQARTPAWTDRILWKGDILHQLQYLSAPLRYSDHRPVFAVFGCEITLIDEPKKSRMRRDIYERQRPNRPTYGSDLLDLAADDSKLGSSPKNIVRPDADHTRSDFSGTPLSEQWDHISNDSELFPRNSANPPKTHQTNSSSLSSDGLAQHSHPVQRSSVAPPPPPPRSSTVPFNIEPSLSNLSLKKKAPPIPRKPVSLAGRSQTTDTETSDSVTSLSPPMPRASTLSGLSKSMSPPSLPPRLPRYQDNPNVSRSLPGGSFARQQNYSIQETQRGYITANPLSQSPVNYSPPMRPNQNLRRTHSAAPQPPLPRRKGNAAPALLDDGPDGLEGWEPLRPS